MSRLTIDISAEQHKGLKAAAALEGKTIKQYAVERLFSQGMIEVTGELAEFLQARIAAAEAGAVSSRSIQDILAEAEREQEAA